MMEDIDPSEIRCWHGNPLLECEDPEHSTKKATAGRGYFSRETVTYYHGTASVYVNITDKANPMYPGSTEYSFICEHRHLEYEDAIKCGERLGRREARKLNKQYGVTGIPRLGG